MSWYSLDLIMCPVCWDRFSTPIEMFNHLWNTNGDCTPTIRRFRRMQRENPKLAARHAHKFPPAYSCGRCNSTGKVRFIPVTPGKMDGWRNCPSCNRNGRRNPKPGHQPYL